MSPSLGGLESSFYNPTFIPQLNTLWWFSLTLRWCRNPFLSAPAWLILSLSSCGASLSSVSTELTCVCPSDLSGVIELLSCGSFSSVDTVVKGWLKVPLPWHPRTGDSSYCNWAGEHIPDCALGYVDGARGTEKNPSNGDWYCSARLCYDSDVTLILLLPVFQLEADRVSCTVLWHLNIS